MPSAFSRWISHVAHLVAALRTKQEPAHLTLGRRGERRAAWHYRLRAYRIVARNVRWNDGEIDLVLRRGRLLVFAEVKTRSSRIGGEAWEAVDRRKRERMITLAGRFVGERRLRDVEIRYDIVSLQWDGHRFELAWFPDAFRPVSDPRYPWRLRA